VTVPPRRATPALLQVDAILARLGGRAALEEVLRFLGAEFPELATLAIELSGTGTIVTGPDGPDPVVPPAAGTPGVAIVAEGRTVGRFVRPGGFPDPSDVGFLTVVAGRLGAAAVAAGATPA